MGPLALLFLGPQIGVFSRTTWRTTLARVAAVFRRRSSIADEVDLESSQSGKAGDDSDADELKAQGSGVGVVLYRVEVTERVEIVDRPA